MKVLKNLVAVVLVTILVFALCAPAFAATPHTYVAYQIFSGTQSTGDDTGKLGDIEWGEDIGFTKLLTALKSAGADFDECVSAQDVARVLATYGEDSREARNFAKIAYSYVTGGTPVASGDVLPAGYYLIIDTTKFPADETDTVYNLALLQLTQKGALDINEKYTVPTVEKKVLEDSNNEWQDAADYNIGEAVPFRLTAKVGDIRDYDTYKLTFYDTLSKGLSYNTESISVTMDGEELAINEDYFLSIVGDKLTVTLNNIIALGAEVDNTFVVNYTATLNSEAVLGNKGNPNDVYLQYSNNPNVSTSTGKTPTQEVKVYTYGVDLNKVTDLNGKTIPLAGAEFELFAADDLTNSLGKKMVAPVTKDGEIVSYTASFDGLDAGSYVLKETTTPDGYNSIKEDITFTIVSGFDGTELDTFTVSGNTSFSAEPVTGRVATDVVNLAGVTLPETGGIGTTIFYVLGAALLTFSVVMFVTKKRVGAEG